VPWQAPNAAVSVIAASRRACIILGMRAPVVVSS
jgi:hypothetical protein